VFESVGAVPNAVENVIQRIYSEWFPSDGYKPADAPELEVCPQGSVDSEDYPGYQ